MSAKTDLLSLTDGDGALTIAGRLLAGLCAQPREFFYLRDLADYAGLPEGPTGTTAAATRMYCLRHEGLATLAHDSEGIPIWRITDHGQRVGAGLPALVNGAVRPLPLPARVVASTRTSGATTAPASAAAARRMIRGAMKGVRATPKTSSTREPDPEIESSTQIAPNRGSEPSRASEPSWNSDETPMPKEPSQQIEPKTSSAPRIVSEPDGSRAPLPESADHALIRIDALAHAWAIMARHADDATLGRAARDFIPVVCQEVRDIITTTQEQT